jgi:DNA-binding response OmpR family regulator
VHVLVIEDERRLTGNLANAISKSGGFVVDIALDGNDGLHLASWWAFDAIILDLMLPGMPGGDVLTALLFAGHKTTVLVLTAK